MECLFCAWHIISSCYYIWKILSLVFCIWNMKWLGVRFLVFILLGVLWTSWIYGLGSVINFGKSSVITTSIIFSAPLSLSSSSGIPSCNYVTVPWMFRCFFVFILFLSLHFGLGSFTGISFSSLILSLATNGLLMSPQRHSSFLLLYFWFPVFPLDFFFS